MSVIVGSDRPSKFARTVVRIRAGSFNPNEHRQRQAVRVMSEAQRITGLTARQLDDLHRCQRQRVLARYGIAA